MIGNEHLPGAQYAFRRSDVWILGFKAEHADTLFRADDHSRLEVLGGTFLNWDKRHGPVIDCRDSRVFAVFFNWHWTVVAETILRDETDGVFTFLPATRFPSLDKVDGAVIAIE